MTHGLTKHVRSVDRNYLAWIRKQPCVVTGQSGTEAAHTETVGSGGGDWTALPLTPAMHREQHTIGFTTFANQYGIDYGHEIEEHHRRYFNVTGRQVLR